MSKKAVMTSSKKWSIDEEEILFFLRRKQGLTYKLIATEMKRTVEACRKKYDSTIWQKKSFYNDVIDDKIPEAKKASYMETAVRAKDRRLDTIWMRTELVAERMKSAIEALPKKTNKVYIPTVNNKKKKKAEEDVALVISDLHIGHEFTLEETGGIAEYNEEIISRRVGKLQHAVGDIIELHSQLYKIPRLHIFCLGDIVAGMNGVGSWSNTFINMSIYDQMARGCEMLAQMIYYWMPMFDEIVFYGIRGNHGRCSPLGMEKDYVNWDIICYDYLQQRFSDNKKVKFVVPKTWWLMTEIREHKFLLVHGDDIKGGSFPVKKLAEFQDKMMGITKEIPNYTIAGHFHNAAEFTTNTGRTIINGAFMGGDVYSIKDLHAASAPTQKLFGIHEKHGVTWTYNVNLATPGD